MTVVALPDVVRVSPLDDPSALAEVVGDATVAAIGENNHYIREFALLRTRLLRTLVTELRCGGARVRIRGERRRGRLDPRWPGPDRDDGPNGFTFRHGDPPEVREMLRWLRGHNAAGCRVRFAGLDVPGSGGSAVPALHRVAAYLAARDPGALALVDAAVAATRPYAAANNGAAPARYAALGAGERDAATAALTRLWLHLFALPAGPTPPRCASRGTTRWARCAWTSSCASS
jgi:erythromycin esterase